MEKKVEYRKKVVVTPESYSTLKKVEKTLADRRYDGETISELIDELLSNLSERKLDQFIEKRTPIEYKLESLLKDPEKRADLEKFLSKSNSSTINSRRKKGISVDTAGER